MSVLRRRTGNKRSYPVKAGAKIDGCSIVLLSAGLAIGLAGAPGTADFAGVSTLGVDNTSGIDGAESVEVEHEEIMFINAGDVTNDKVGSTVYISAVNTVSISHNTNSRPTAGTVTQVGDDGVWVLPEVK